tara:strand:+ start:127 stop:2148 length:2022 start_codon:yes stop_codon:yes gene_type:complete
VGGQVPTAPSARPSARPGPKPFEQQELFPVRRVTDVSDKAIDTYAADEDDGDGGYSGTGYPITGAKPLDLTVTPFVRGTDLPEDVPGSIPPGVNTAYAGQLIEQAFGFGGYKYNSLTGRVERDDLKAISMALPGTIGFAAGIGSALSKKNLERIARKADAQEEGFALGMLQGRIVGVSPAPTGSGYVLSGVLPQNLSPQQRQTVAEQLLGISQRSRAEFAKEQEERQRRINESQATQEETDAGAGLFQPGDTPAQPDPRYTPPPPVTYTTDPGDRDDSAPAGNQYSLDNYGSSYSATDFSFEDARMGRAEGGSVQRTGFVEGSPDNYAKGDTVADTVKTKVRENSFVLNAPTVERLQQAGMLPKGVDNSDKNATIKANKGGLMDVALSKGEYVIEPEEAQRIGYSFLEKINDQGKAEVDRRQAAADGGAIDGYSNGGNTGMLRYAGPLSAIELMKSGLSVTTPEGFIGGPTTYDGPYPSSETDAPPDPLPPLLINGIDVGAVQKALTLVETRGYEDRNEGYFFTRSDTAGKESSAFGPLQITKKTLEAMVADNFGQLELAFKTEPGLKEYYDKLIVEGRNAVNVRRYGDIYEGPEGDSKPTNASEEEKAKYRGLGYGNIALEEHKKYYPTVAGLYMRYKAGMSKSEEDLVRRHFGNSASTKKYYDAKKELGIT